MSMEFTIGDDSRTISRTKLTPPHSLMASKAPGMTQHEAGEGLLPLATSSSSAFFFRRSAIALAMRMCRWLGLTIATSGPFPMIGLRLIGTVSFGISNPLAKKKFFLAM